MEEINDNTIKNLYQEARKCYSANAFTASVLCSRNLLMNFAISKGYREGPRFVQYIEYLAKNHYIPPDSKEWIENIKNQKNEANYEIANKSKEDAEELIIFSERFLRYNFEFQKRMNKNPWQFLYRVLENKKDELIEIIKCKSSNSFIASFEEFLKKNGIGITFKMGDIFSISNPNYNEYPAKFKTLSPNTQYYIYFIIEEGDKQFDEIKSRLNNIVKEIDSYDNFGTTNLREIIEGPSPKKTVDLGDVLRSLVRDESSAKRSNTNKYAIVCSKRVSEESISKISNILEDYKIELISLQNLH